MAELHAPRRIGFAKGIERKLDALEADPAALRDFVAALRVPARDFDWKRFVAILEAAGDDE